MRDTVSVKGIYAVLSIINIIINVLFGVSEFVYCIWLVLLFFLYSKKINSHGFLMYSLFLPNKYLQLLSIPLFLVFNNFFFKRNIYKNYALFLLYISVISIVNCIVYDGLVFSSIFQIVFYYCLLRVIETMDNEDICSMSFFDDMFWIQCIAVGIQLLVLRQTGDALNGTLVSAHYLGVFIVAYIYCVLLNKSSKMNSRYKVVQISLAVIILLLADAKHIWGLFILAIIMMMLLKGVKSKITISVLAMTISIILFVQLANLPFVRNIINSTMVGAYVYNDQYNRKFTFFANTLEVLKSWNGILGFGVGQYGSQISLTMSKGIIYAWNAALQNYHYAIKPYIDAISGIMTEWYTRDGISMSSMVLGYPLVSYSAFIGELGLLGFIMFTKILDKTLCSEGKVLIIYFFMLSVFDTYFEIPCVWLLLLIMAKMQKKLEYEKLKGYSSYS